MLQPNYQERLKHLRQPGSTTPCEALADGGRGGWGGYLIPNTNNLQTYGEEPIDPEMALQTRALPDPEIPSLHLIALLVHQHHADDNCREDDLHP